MADGSSKKSTGLNTAILIVLVGSIIIIVLLFLSRRAKAILSDQLCGEGFELTFLPEFGGWRCFDGTTVQIPVCPDGKFWDRENGKCLTECPPDYTPSPGNECIKTGPVPNRGLMTGRLINSVTSLPIPDYEVFIELNEFPFDMTKTGPDGKFLFDILLNGGVNVGIVIWIGGGNTLVRIAYGVTGDHDFGDFVFGIGPPVPIEFNRIYQVREQIQQLPFDPAFPFDSYWKVACDAIDLTGESGDWKSNVFYHDWGQNNCPGQEGIPDEKPYFLFRRNDGVYFLIQEGKDLSESREIGGPY